LERRKMLEDLYHKLIGKKNLNSEVNTVDFISGLQEEEKMLEEERNCKSYRDFREVDEDFADKDAGDLEL